MTFEEFWDNAGWHTDCKKDVREVWDAAQQAEREKYAELITAAEAVIETAKRHRNVGYADRQMVYLQAVVERLKNEN